jgi:DNA polymerase-1
MDEAVITYVESIDEVMEFKRWLSEEHTWLAFDLETGGLESWKQPIRLFQFGDPNAAFVFRADRWMGVCEEVLNTYEGRIVGHNIGFDYRFIQTQAGIIPPWHRSFDTMIMAHNIDPTRSKALKTLGAQFLSPTAKRLQNVLNSAMKQQGWGWDTVPYDYNIYTGYAGVDVLLTSALAEQLWLQIESNYRPVFDLEMQISRICSNMEMRGIPIDVQYCETIYEKITHFCEEAEKWCVENYGVRPSQNQEVARKLIDEGCQLSKLTATGKVAMDEESLARVDHPLAKMVIEHRKKTKIGNTYFRNFLRDHDNGVLHPSINTLGARTGRMSVQNPAAQTLPRGSVVRNAFVASPNNGWISADYNAIEMRLLAHFSKDEGMLSAIRAGNVHLEMAKLIYGDDSITKEDSRYNKTKNSNFCKAYSGGLEKFAMTAGIPVDEAEEFLTIYDARFPGVKGFQKTIDKTGTQRLRESGRAYVKSRLGRIHYAEPAKIYTLGNSLLQGSASDVFKQALVDLDHSGFGPYMVLPNHDEQCFDFPLELIKNGALKEVEKVMTQDDWLVPLTVSVEGPYERWGGKYQ